MRSAVASGRRPLCAAVLCAAGLLCVSTPRVARAEVEQEAVVEAEAEVEEIDPTIFDDALEDFYDGDFVSAAAGFWGYVHFGQPSADRYEWAQFFLGESLAGLGLWHAAVQYYYLVAKTRSRPEILPEALARLEAISAQRPFNELLVYSDLLYDSDFGALPRTLRDWVSYVKGAENYRRDFAVWAERDFAAIDPSSPYALRAAYVRAVAALKRGEDDAARAELHRLVESPVAATPVKNRAYLALARLLFDERKYDDAWAMYERVLPTELSFEQAQLLEEKAWTAYHRDDGRRAMGLLHALESPAYASYFLPDAFILRGLILKSYCHFIPAKRVVRSFRYRLGPAIEQLHQRRPMAEIRAIVAGATQEGPIARRTALLRSLRTERRELERHDSAWDDVELDAHLRRLYDLEIKEQSRQWQSELETAATGIAERLLEVEEQMNLLDYEIGLDIFKRLKAADARRVREETLQVPYDSANVYYQYDTEYWNDELHSYEYFITSRCFEAEVQP